MNESSTHPIVSFQNLPMELSIQKQNIFDNLSSLPQGEKTQDVNQCLKCFNAFINKTLMRQILLKRELIANQEQLQVILLKLWDLGKYVRCTDMLSKSLPLQMRRNPKAVVQQKINFLQNHIGEQQNVPLRVLAMPDCQTLLQKISLALYIILDTSISLSTDLLIFSDDHG